MFSCVELNRNYLHLCIGSWFILVAFLTCLTLFVYSGGIFIVIAVLCQEPDEFFEKEKTFLTEYHGKLAIATQKADRLTRSQKGIIIIYCRVWAL